MPRDLFNKGESKMDRKLRFGFPKGSLEEMTLELFKRAGFRIERR